MNTETKLAMLALISVSMLTAIIVMSVTSLVIPAFAIKEHCDKSDSICDIKTAENSPATQEDEPYTDSNIVLIKVRNATRFTGRHFTRH